MGKSLRLLLFVSILFKLCPHGFANEARQPFHPGERLIYELRWGLFKVGTAVFEVEGPVELDGQPAYKFVFTIKTNRFADGFYKIRDRYEGYSNLEMSRSLLFRKQEQHNRRKRNVTVTFDWDAQTVQYERNGEKQDPLPLDHTRCFDPLSALFAARALPLSIGSEYTLPITDGKKLATVPIKVIKKQKLKMQAGTFETFLITPDFRRLKKNPRKNKRASTRIWFSADSRKIPVKIHKRAIWGRFEARLVAIQ